MLKEFVEGTAWLLERGNHRTRKWDSMGVFYSTDDAGQYVQRQVLDIPDQEDRFAWRVSKIKTYTPKGEQNAE